MNNAQTTDRPSVLQSIARLDAVDASAAPAREASRVAFENRIRAIATNAVLEAMVCYKATRLTDDHAGRVDAIERILTMPQGSVAGYVTLVPIEQNAHPKDTTRLQNSVADALSAPATGAQQADQQEIEDSIAKAVAADRREG